MLGKLGMGAWSGAAWIAGPGLALPGRGLSAVDAVLAWLGMAALAGLCWMIHGHRQRRRQALLQRTRAGQPLEADLRTSYLLLLAAGSGVLLLLMALLLQAGAWLLAALLSLAALLGIALTWDLLLAFRRPGPMLRMDRHGVSSAAYGRIPWCDVIGIELQSVRHRHGSMHTLALCVRNPGRYLEHATPLLRWIRRRLRDEPIGTLMLDLNALDEEAGVIHHTALALRRRDPAPFLEAWTRHMDRTAVEAFIEARGLDSERERIIAELQAVGDQAPLPATVARPAPQAPSEAAELHFRRALAAHVRRTRRRARDARLASWVVLGLALLVALVVLLR